MFKRSSYDDFYEMLVFWDDCGCAQMAILRNGSSGYQPLLARSLNSQVIFFCGTPWFSFPKEQIYQFNSRLLGLYLSNKLSRNELLCSQVPTWLLKCCCVERSGNIPLPWSKNLKPPPFSLYHSYSLVIWVRKGKNRGPRLIKQWPSRRFHHESFRTADHMYKVFQSWSYLSLGPNPSQKRLS